MSDLPDGWNWVKIADLASSLGNGRSVPDGPEDGYPVLRLTAIRSGLVDITANKKGNWTAEDARPFRIRKGDYLVVRGNGSKRLVGRGGIVQEDAEIAFPDTMIRIRFDEAKVRPKYGALIWDSPLIRSEIESAARTSAGIYKISQKDLRKILIPLPPLREQERIIITIEEHFSRLDAGITALERGARNLAAMRASALNDVLKGEDGVPHDAIRLEEILVRGRYGTSTKCSYEGKGVPVLRIPNVHSGTIDLTDLKYAADASVNLASSRVESGDILIIRTNGSRSLIGRSAVVPDLKSETAFASYLIQLKVDGARVDPAYLVVALGAPYMRRKIEALAATSAGQYNISLEKLRSLMIPLPSLARQRIALSKAEHLFSGIDHVGQEIRNQRIRAGRLRLAILAQSFAGELIER